MTRLLKKSCEYQYLNLIKRVIRNGSKKQGEMVMFILQ